MVQIYARSVLILKSGEGGKEGRKEGGKERGREREH